VSSQIPPTNRNRAKMPAMMEVKRLSPEAFDKSFIDDPP
jgi:hypothetical protein